MEDDSFLPRLICSDEATLHLSGKVNRHNVRIWGTQNPRETVEHERDSPKVNVFVPFLKQRLMVLTSSRKKQLLGDCIPKCCRNDSFHNLMQIPMASFFSKMGAPPHWYQEVRDFLNASLPQHWIGHMGPEDLTLHFGAQDLQTLHPATFSCGGTSKTVFCSTISD
jgi:hypothetical protein